MMATYSPCMGNKSEGFACLKYRRRFSIMLSCEIKEQDIFLACFTPCDTMIDIIYCKYLEILLVIKNILTKKCGKKHVCRHSNSSKQFKTETVTLQIYTIFFPPRNSSFNKMKIVISDIFCIDRIWLNWFVEICVILPCSIARQFPWSLSLLLIWGWASRLSCNENSASASCVILSGCRAILVLHTGQAAAVIRHVFHRHVDINSR